MRNVKIISAYQPKDGSAAGNRIEFYLKALSGMNARLFTSTNQSVETGKSSCIETIYSEDNEFKGNIFLRFINETLYCLKLARFANISGNDLVIFSVPHLSFVFLIRLLKLKHPRVRIIVDVRDLTWLYINKNNSVVEAVISSVLTKICLFNIKKADHIFVTNTSQQEHISVSNSNVDVLPNGISLDKFDLLTLDRTDKSSPGKVNILYAGNFGILQNLFTILAAFSQLPGDKFKLTLIGGGAHAGEIQEYIKKNKLENKVELIASVSFEKLLSFYNECDILYGQIICTEALKTAVPSKIYEYASIGKPIVFGINGVGETELNKLWASYVVEPENIDKLVTCLEGFVDQNTLDKAKTSALKNVKFAENHFVRENYHKQCFNKVNVIAND